MSFLFLSEEMTKWLASQGDWLMSDGEEDACLAASRRADQQRNNPLFRANFQMIGGARSWQQQTAVLDSARLRLEQLRAPAEELLGEAMAEGFRQGLLNVVHERGFVPENYSLQLAVHHSSGTHVWTRSPVIPLTDWVQNNQHSSEWMEKLAKQLNSAEDIDVAKGEFYVELNFFKYSGRGSGWRGKKYNPGRMSYEALLKKKHCVILIKNKDQLCCARAIVTVKARVDNDVQYDHLKRGRGLQEFSAKKLHQDVGVAEGPCGRKELKQFQEYLGPEYQLIVLEGLKGKILFKDKQYDQAPKVIALLKTENHYHGVTSIPAFLNRSYFCRHCEKGYNTQDRTHHNCIGQNCSDCRRGNKTCPNFAKWVTPEVSCEQCHVKLYGPECYEAHLQKQRGQKGICERLRKCLECCKVYEVKGKKKDQCCVCGKVIDVNHDCFIQPLAEDKKKTDLGVIEEETEDYEASDTEEESRRPPLKPLLCFVDLQCSLNEEKKFEVHKSGLVV